MKSWAAWFRRIIWPSETDPRLEQAERDIAEMRVQVDNLEEEFLEHRAQFAETMQDLTGRFDNE